MGIIGRNWSEDPALEEQYEEITGNKFNGSKRDLEKEIELGINNNFTSRTERKKLIDLQNNINQD